MSALESLISATERLPLPDSLTRLGIKALIGRTARKLGRAPRGSEEQFARDMERYPIAEHADAANDQHYELPPEFFVPILGPQLKYSSCLYDRGDTTLAQAEERALAETARHADLADGQAILELGCGWGSLSLWMARNFPRAQITAVSNSADQRRHIESRIVAENLGNLHVITADMNHFEPQEKFDRIVSVEMFEHMANWRGLLQRVRGWIKPEGRVFIHVFTHRSAPYRFELDDKTDWIAQHFFTGGIMPSHTLLQHFGDLFRVEEEWSWSGEHYAKTARDWLANYDRNQAVIQPVLARVYGADAKLWNRRWRLFFLATEGLFGYSGGNVWGVSHYRLAPA